MNEFLRGFFSFVNWGFAGELVGFFFLGAAIVGIAMLLSYLLQ